MKIIIIDDEMPSINVFLSNIVDEHDIELSAFMHNPLSAIEAVKTKEVAAAFLDINMPVINGVVLAEKLIAVAPDIKIVFISGYSQNESQIKERLGSSLLGFCYKPYSPDQLYEYIQMIKIIDNENRVIKIKTFGGFDIFDGERLIKFASTKAKELLALCVDKEGLSVGMGSAIAYLWGDKSPELGKRLYRDAVFRLRKTLTANNLAHLIDVSRAKISINKLPTLQCDVWNFLVDESDIIFGGSYMPDYEWSMETQYQLENILERRTELPN